MLKIVKVSPTVGVPDVYAVVIKDENSTDVHAKLQEYITATYGKYTSIAYLAQFQTPVIDFSEYGVTGFIDADALLEYSK